MIPYSNEYVLQYIAKLTTKNYTDGLDAMKKRTESTTSSLSKQFDKLGKEITTTIAKKMSLAGAALYVGNKFRLAIQDMVAYQKQMSMFNTLLKGSREELNKYADEFINISIRTGQAKETIIEGAYQALSSGIPKEELTDFIEIAAKTATAGKTSAETAIATMASVMNAYKLSAVEAGDVADWLLTIQNKGVTTVDELGKSLANITSVAAPLGISLNDVGAALAVMTQNGKNTAESTTLLKAMISDLAKSGTQAADRFEKLAGTTFLNFIKQGNSLKDALDLLDKEGQRTGETMLDLFGGVDAGNGAMLLTGKNAKQFADRLKDVSNRAGEMEDAYKTSSSNIATEWDRLCNAMDSKWRKLVTWLEEPIYITIKEVRQAIDGQDNAVENLDSNRAKLAELEARKAKINKNKSARYRDREKGELLGDIAKLKAEIKRGEEMLAQQQKELEEKRAEEEKKRKAQQELEAKQAAIQASIDRTKAVETKEKEHKLKLTKIENDFLMQQKDYITQQQKMLNDGLISKEEYNKNIEDKNKELKLQQQKANLQLYKEMEEFYKSVGDIANAEENKKHVIEIELEIQKNITTNTEQAEQDYLQAEAERRKEYQTKMIANEWEYLTELTTLRESGNFTKEQIDQIYEERMREMEVKRLEREQEELQNRLNFYNSDISYKQQAVDTMQQIRDNELKLESLKNNKWTNLTVIFENYKTEIRKRSLNALKQSYDAFAKGEMKSLEDFKKFAQMQLVELMASLGAKHLEMAISEGGLAVVDFAKAATYAAAGSPRAAAYFASGNEHLGAAALNASLAAAWGAGGATMANMGNGNSSNDSDDDKIENTTINDQIGAAKEESEGTVYIDVSNSALTKLLIKDIEKELKDGYNVSLIAKKKR